MISYAKPMTFVRAKVMRLEARTILPMGPTRSIPHGIDTPHPNDKRPRPEERPMDPGAQSLQGKPLTEPESVPTLEPVSRL